MITDISQNIVMLLSTYILTNCSVLLVTLYDASIGIPNSKHIAAVEENLHPANLTLTF